MEHKKARNINRASEELTDSARQAFQMLVDRTVSLQESNLRLTQSFFQNFVEHLQSQGQAVQKQSQRQREAFETLYQEATNAYSEFLNSALSFYQEAMSTASQAAQDNLQGASQATQQGVQTVQQAAEAAEVASQTVHQVAQAGGWESGASQWELVRQRVLLEDLTQKEIDKSERFLVISPAEKGSGSTDVSVNHDRYLNED
jgi:hypothetical protein